MTTAADAFRALIPSAVPWEPPPSAETVAKRLKGKSDLDPSASTDESPGGRGAERLFPLLEDQQRFRDESGATYILLQGRLYLLDTKNRELVECLTLFYWGLARKPLAKEAAQAWASTAAAAPRWATT